MNGTVEIHQFEMMHYDDVYKLWKEVFPATTDSTYDRANITRFLDRNPGLSFAAECDGTIVGAVLTGYDVRRGYIHHLGILGTHRRKRIGKMLLNAVENALREIGVTKAHLFVLKDNHEAKLFYDDLLIVELHQNYPAVRKTIASGRVVYQADYNYYMEGIERVC